MATSSILRLFLLLVLLPSAVPQVTVDVSPSEIIPGLSQWLDVNCTFSLDTTSTLAAIVSLQLSRGNASGMTDLALINDVTPYDVTQLGQENFTAVGVLNQGGESFLHLHWGYPTGQQSGLYRCSAEGVDQMGQPAVMISDAVVSVKNPDNDDFVNKMKEMDTYMKDRLAQMDEYTKRLEESLAQMDSYTKGLEQQIDEHLNYTTTLEQKLSELENYTKNLEERVSSVDIRLRISDMFYDPFTYDGHKYYVSVDMFRDTNESMEICLLYGGELALIDDADEYHYLQHYLQDTSRGFYRVVIQGSDEDSEGNWTHQFTEESLPYVDWFENQPDGGFKENCLYLSTPDWQMWDTACHLSTPSPDIRFMCEIPLAAATATTATTTTESSTSASSTTLATTFVTPPLTALATATAQVTAGTLPSATTTRATAAATTP